MTSLRRFFKRIYYAWVLFNNPKKPPSFTYNKYPKHYTFPGKRVLNIGCGNTTYPAPNVVNTDLYPVPGVNIVLDLSKTPFPFPDNEFDLVIANHILEHVPNWWECFKELARVVKVGGIIEVWLPGDGGSSQLGYRDHINTINHCSFVGIRGTHRNAANAWEQEDRKNLGFIKDLKLAASRTRLWDFWWVYAFPDVWLNWAAEHLRNVICEQGYFFTKLPPLGEGK